MSEHRKDPESPPKSPYKRSPISYCIAASQYYEQLKNNQYENLDIESTYEESFNQQSHYKTVDINQDLCKITEYNESLEFSVSNEDSDLAGKMNEFNTRISNSIADKFPKISIASMCFSDSSNYNPCDTYKKSYLDYIENLEIVNYTEHEMTEIESHPDENIEVVKGQLDFKELDKNEGSAKIEKFRHLCGCNICSIY